MPHTGLMTRPALIWFRRDLRLADLPPLLAAADRTDDALAVFVLDEALCRPAGRPRLAFLTAALRALDRSLGGRLLVLDGDPVRVIPQLAAAIGADSVHISADFGPYGARRDDAVAAALAALPTAVPLVRTGSPYAVAPGRLLTGAGGPYRVFTPFSRAWLAHGWRAPARTGVETLTWLDPHSVASGPGAMHGFGAVDLAETAAGSRHRSITEERLAGEAAALARWRDFTRAGGDLDRYAADRDRPDVDATARLSAHLKFGCLHPRTLLHDLRDRTDPGAAGFRKELAWREFYADVLHHRPDTARANVNGKFDAIEYDTGPDADAAFAAWCAGRTGFPIVDAGMRQLRAEAWMHNRVRMIVASFLTKDLHLPWWRGARYFMTHLVDGDLASNQHGWQWTAGSGTDAAPYFRVFNPVTQGERFDPAGDYVRRWVPELRGLGGKAVHQPWKRPDAAADYPAPIVDHRVEREVALARYARL